ncbi:MAG: hypothetical protein ACRCUS_04830 [Anaerovoracaceae bacterium]
MKEWFARNKELGEWDTLIYECLLDLNRCNTVEPKEKEIKRNLKFDVGDQVIITRRRKVGTFNEGLGTIDKVKAITGSNTVELENNRIQSNKDLIKK